MSLFRAFVKSFVKNVGNYASGLLGVPIAGDILVNTWEYWEKDSADEQQRKAELEAYARQAVKDALPEALEAVRLEAPQLSEAQRQLLVDYLCQVPATIQRSLRRPEDRTGRSVPPGLALRNANDLLPFLPPTLPRFRPGDALPGKAGWLLDRQLGVGGFGEVWLARKTGYGSLVGAVKFCHNLQTRDRDMLHESKMIDQLLSQVKHPNVVPLLDVHLDGEVPWLMYEYVEGGDLGDMIRHSTKLPPAERQQKVVTAMQLLAKAVGQFHRLNPPIVHRDLKPANILYDKKTHQLRITDFGIGGIGAREMIDGEKRGSLSAARRLQSHLYGSYTPLYASPQQKAGDPPDPHDDVHALGVIAYQMLTCQMTQGVGADYARDLKELGVGQDLIDLVGRCASQRADRRPKDAGEIATVLSRLLSAKNSPAPTTPVARVSKQAASASPATDKICRVDPSGRGEYRTLEEAVAESSTGAEIHLAAGTHNLAAPLNITKPITLIGEGMDVTRILCRGEAYVVKFSAAGLFRAVDLAFVSDSGPNRTRTRVVEVDQGEVSLGPCRFSGGIADEDADSTWGNGLWLHGTARGHVEACEVVGNDKSGIYIEEQAEATLRGNKCKGNKGSGIYYSASTAGTVQLNFCEGNQEAGIVVDEQARPTLDDNSCRENKAAGIRYSGSAGGTAQKNDCGRNETAGIEVWNEARPTLEGNTCKGNKRPGIAYFGSAAGTARNNACTANDKGGIIVRDKANPTLEGNTCRENKGAGISYSDSAGGMAQKNDCVLNGTGGIEVLEKASPTLEGNTCKGNKAGIAYFGSAAGTARNNACNENERDGILVREDAKPTLAGNTCRDNKGDGLNIGSTAKPRLKDNRCSGNKGQDVDDQRP